jgi:hypothetical protein
MVRPVQEKEFLFFKTSKSLWGPFSPYSMGNGGSYSRAERLVFEAGHSVPSRGNIKNEGGYSSTPSYSAIMEWTSVNLPFLLQYRLWYHSLQKGVKDKKGFAHDLISDTIPALFGKNEKGLDKTVNWSRYKPAGYEAGMLTVWLHCSVNEMVFREVHRDSRIGCGQSGKLCSRFGYWPTLR